MNEDSKIEIIKNTLQHRIALLQGVLYTNKAYEDEETRAFWEGKLSAYQDILYLLKSKIENMIIEV